MHRVVQRHRYRIERIIEVTITTTIIIIVAATATAIVFQHKETNRIQKQEFGHTELVEYLRQHAVHLAYSICRGFPFLV